MLNPTSPLARLLAAPMRTGRVTWLGTRPARHEPLLPVEMMAIDPAGGISGDHYAGRSGTRQITLIGAIQVTAIATFLGRDHVDPGDLRRNVVVAGLNLHALKGCRLRIGTAEIEVTGECHPCSRMELAFGPGGYNAVRGHGGLTARIVAGGVIGLGDEVSRL